MENRRGNLRTLILMIVAALFVVLVIGVVSFFSTKGDRRDGITLPPADWNPTENSGASPEDGLVAVTRENAWQIVESMSRPVCYHQTIVQKTTSSAAVGEQRTDVWVKDGVWRIITASGGQTRHILTDGSKVYLWYSDDTRQVESVSLPEGVMPDDLSGVPTYESIAGIEVEEIAVAEYRHVAEPEDTPCLFVETKNASGITVRYWVNLNTGLLCKAETQMGETVIQSLDQTALAILEGSDPALQRNMTLPNGTVPFSTGATETPQS